MSRVVNRAKTIQNHCLSRRIDKLLVITHNLMFYPGFASRKSQEERAAKHCRFNPAGLNPALQEELNVRKTMFIVTLLLLVASVGNAQQQDTWETLTECLQATGAPYYVPTTISRRELAKNEIEVPAPTDGCIEMLLPDRQMKQGFARVKQGDILVVDRVTQRVLRLGKCKNHAFSWTPIPPPPPPPSTVTAEPERVEEPVIVLPTPPPAPEPVPEIESPPEPKPEEVEEPATEAVGVQFQIGAGVLAGRLNRDFTYPDPSRGDVPQRHRLVTPVLMARADQSSNAGFFGSLVMSFRGSLSTAEFQDIRGVWNTKRRDTDNSRDKVFQITGGYKLPISETISVGPKVSFERWCVSCEKYFAQNTSTETRLTYQTLGIGAEAVGSSDWQNLIVRFEGIYGLKGNRNKWTEQHFSGPPAIDFPRVEDNEQGAKLHRIGASADARIYRIIRGFASVSWLQWNSTRPVAHPAQEHTKLLGLMFGIRLGN